MGCDYLVYYFGFNVWNKVFSFLVFLKHYLNSTWTLFMLLLRVPGPTIHHFMLFPRQKCLFTSERLSLSSAIS